MFGSFRICLPISWVSSNLDDPLFNDYRFFNSDNSLRGHALSYGSGSALAMGLQYGIIRSAPVEKPYNDSYHRTHRPVIYAITAASSGKGASV